MAADIAVCFYGKIVDLYNLFLGDGLDLVSNIVCLGGTKLDACTLRSC